MAFTKKPPPVYDPAIPINPYGCKTPGRSQFDYDRRAFSKRIDESFGCPSRLELFRRISESLVPGWFEWHAWTNRLIDAGCNHRFVGITGCCVAGHTRMLNPTTGGYSTIQYLCEKGIAPIVMTLDGPAQADVPYIKGVDDLFEITLSNGSKFTATSDHRVLTSQGFAFVKSLYLRQALIGYAPTPRVKTSASGQLIHALNARCSQKTVEGFQVGYRVCSCCGDEPLPLEVNISRSSVPLQAGVREHIRSYRRWDDPGHRFGRTREGLSTRSCHLPNCEPFLLSGSSGNPSSRPPYQEMLLPIDLLSPRFFQCDSTNNRCSPFQELNPDSSHKRSISSFGYSIQHVHVVSIRKIGRSQYYDISVPGPEHYFAEGTIHHNSGAAKTRNMAGWACSWWLADPANSSVIFCSTTMKMLRKRGWNEVQGYRNALVAAQGEDFGNFVDSRTVWQYDQGDDKHAIFCLAVQEGDINKTAANIQGIHTRRQLVIIDEAPAVPSAIWKACANLYSYPIDSGGEFVMMAAGNPRSRIDQFGRFIEPAGGWDTVSIDTEEWEGKPQLDGSPTFVIRFDFCKSPNITEGKVVSKHLPTKHRVESRMANLKARGAENDADHYCYDRGFPAPEGMSKTVFTESLIIKHGGYDQHQFTGTNFQIIGAYDQARTGDRPALRFAAMGDIAGNKLGIEWMEPIVLYSDSTSKDPLAYQQLSQVKKHCENVKYRGQVYKCEPGNLGIDCSNEASFADICQREWSPDIIRVLFGAGASEDPASPEDPRPANEVYRNKRAEMFFRTRNCLESGQLKGIDKDTAAEMCSLEYSELRNDGTSKPITIQEKREFRLKFGKSCDLIDAGVIITEVARLKGFRIVATGHTVQRTQSFDKVVDKAQEVYVDADYTKADEPWEESEFVNE